MVTPDPVLAWLADAADAAGLYFGGALNVDGIDTAALQLGDSQTVYVAISDIALAMDGDDPALALKALVAATDAPDPVVTGDACAAELVAAIREQYGQEIESLALRGDGPDPEAWRGEAVQRSGRSGRRTARNGAPVIPDVAPSGDDAPPTPPEAPPPATSPSPATDFERTAVLKLAALRAYKLVYAEPESVNAAAHMTFLGVPKCFEEKCRRYLVQGATVTFDEETGEGLCWRCAMLGPPDSG